jgi:hypothetical protein
VVQIEWQQLGTHILLHINQQGSSQNTPVFQFTLPLTVYYQGGDSTVYLNIHEAEQSYSLNFPYRILGIAADTGSDVLAKVIVVPVDTSGKYLLVHPNPAAGNISVEFFNKDASRTITIINLGGQIIRKFNSSDAHIDLDIRHWTPGVYVLMVTENKLRYATRFVIP